MDVLFAAGFVPEKKKTTALLASIDTPGDRLAQVYHALRAEGLVTDQQDFAKKVGIYNTHLSSMISGKRNISKTAILRLVKDYGISEEWLTKGIGSMKEAAIPTDALELLQQIAKDVAAIKKHLKLK